MSMTTDRPDSASQTGDQRYRYLFEHVPICVFVADLAGIPPSIVEANRRAELVYGYTAAEMVGMPATQLAPEDARLAVLAIVQQVQQGQMVTAEITNQRRDGTRFPVHIIAAPDPTDASHMIVTVEDITAKKQPMAPVVSLSCPISTSSSEPMAVSCKVGRSIAQILIMPHTLRAEFTTLLEVDFAS